MPDELFLQATVDRFEGEYAILKTEDGEELKWPRKNLPSSVHEGNILYLQTMLNTEKEAEREKLAKTLLNEILKNDE